MEHRAAVDPPWLFPMPKSSQVISRRAEPDKLAQSLQAFNLRFLQKYFLAHCPGRRSLRLWNAADVSAPAAADAPQTIPHCT